MAYEPEDTIAGVIPQALAHPTVGSLYSWF